MSQKHIFCKDCHDEIDISFETTTLSSEFKGHTYNFDGIKTSTSCENGHMISTEEINAYNKKSLYDTYRLQNHILSLDKIRELPLKYHIGKRPLSHLLEWGELTFTRYYDGDMPSKAYSQILELIYHNPQAYIDLLEKNKALISPKAYEKSLSTAQLLLQDSTDLKISQIFHYITSKCYDITPFAVEKLLYYCQGFYGAFFEEPLFKQDCYADDKGVLYQIPAPIFLNIQTENFQTDYDDIFSLKEKVVIDCVMKYMACFSGQALANFTMAQIPWIESYSNFNQNTNQNNLPIIPQEEIRQQFKQIIQIYNILSPQEIYKYTKELWNV